MYFFSPIVPCVLPINETTWVGCVSLISCNNVSSLSTLDVPQTHSILFDSKVILLDEPCSNLDMDNIKWFQNLINNYKNDRLIIVASNFINEETKFSNIKLKIQNYNIVEINN